MRRQELKMAASEDLWALESRMPMGDTKLAQQGGGGEPSCLSMNVFVIVGRPGRW